LNLNTAHNQPLTFGSGLFTLGGNLQVAGNATTTGALAANTFNGNTISQGGGTLNLSGNTLTVSGTSNINQNLRTTDSPTFAALSLTNALTTANGGTGTNTLASLTVGTNLSITGGQKVLIGTSTQISISANPSFTSITATATSSLASASSTALTVSGPAWITGTATLATTSVTTLTANTFNGLTLNVGTGTLTLNSNTLALQGGNTTLIGANSISTSTISQIILNGNGNTLSLFGNANINQNLTTTSTPSFAGLTITGNATTTGSSTMQGPLAITTQTTPQLTLGYNAGNYWSSTVASTGGLTFDGNGTSTNFTIKLESSSVSDNYSSQNKIASSYNVSVSASNLQLGQSTTVCGAYSVTGIDGLIYGTVVGADGNCWLDRNLGATEVAASSIDTASYGYYYQWGRGYDGHQISTSPATTTLSSTATPGNNDFIESNSSPYDWVSPQINTLWQSPSYTNNPCPSGFYPPTQTQWATLVTDAGITNSATAFSSSLKLPLAGNRNISNAGLYSQGSLGYYWSSSPNGTSAYYLYFTSSGVNPANTNNRANGFSVRCVN
jgi:uncharacterized protein (TIGR02145 family)